MTSPGLFNIYHRHSGTPQGLITIYVNILSMHKHVTRADTFFTPTRFKSCLFFKSLLIYSKPCLVQLSTPYSFQKISWPPLDYLLWRRSGCFCQEIACPNCTDGSRSAPKKFQISYRWRRLSIPIHVLIHSNSAIEQFLIHCNTNYIRWNTSYKLFTKNFTSGWLFTVYRRQISTAG